jgi:hypothetical protein
MAVTTGGQASTGTAPAPSATARQETILTSRLSIRNKLLFAQAVHRLGAPVGKETGNNWNAVIKLLRDCPVLTDEEKEMFTEHVSFMRGSPCAWTDDALSCCLELLGILRRFDG